MDDVADDELAGAAAAVLQALGTLAGALSPIERAVLGAMLAPGIARALEGAPSPVSLDPADGEREPLPRRLAEAARRHPQDLRFG